MSKRTRAQHSSTSTTILFLCFDTIGMCDSLEIQTNRLKSKLQRPWKAWSGRLLCASSFEKGETQLTIYDVIRAKNINSARIDFDICYYTQENDKIYLVTVDDYSSDIYTLDIDLRNLQLIYKCSSTVRCCKVLRDNTLVLGTSGELVLVDNKKIVASTTVQRTTDIFQLEDGRIVTLNQPHISKLCVWDKNLTRITEFNLESSYLKIGQISQNVFCVFSGVSVHFIDISEKTRTRKQLTWNNFAMLHDGNHVIVKTVANKVWVCQGQKELFSFDTKVHSGWFSSVPVLLQEVEPRIVVHAHDKQVAMYDVYRKRDILVNIECPGEIKLILND